MAKNYAKRGRMSTRLENLPIGSRFFADGQLFEVVGFRPRTREIWAAKLTTVKFEYTDIVNVYDTPENNYRQKD